MELIEDAATDEGYFISQEIASMIYNKTDTIK